MENTRCKVGSGPIPEEEKNIEYYKRLSDKGDSDAMVKVGEMAEEAGDDYEYAGIRILEWYKKAALAGNVMGMSNVCRCYAEYEEGSLEEAEVFANKAVSIGGSAAADTALWMGSCYGGYQSGEYSDVIKALYWYEKAVELNEDSGFAAERIADLYAKGILVSKNIAKAKK